MRGWRARHSPLSSPTCTLRSTEWDGPAPATGDLLCTTAGTWYLVLDVASGAGLGQYRLHVLRMGKARPPAADEPDATVWRWRWAPRHRRP